jgi:hypothetical protein
LESERDATLARFLEGAMNEDENRLRESSRRIVA